MGDTAVPDDYWRTATVAEVLLLQGKVEAAAKLYAAAVLAAPLEFGSHESTRGQAELLLSALGATDEQKKLVAAAFPPATRTGIWVQWSCGSTIFRQLLSLPADRHGIGKAFVDGAHIGEAATRGDNGKRRSVSRLETSST